MPAWPRARPPSQGATGSFHLDQPEAIVSALQPLNYRFTWTVPEPLGWPHLRDLQFRIRDNDNILLWLRFDEASRTFSLYNPGADRFGSSAPAGASRRLVTSAVILDLRQTSVVAAGPSSPTVTLNLPLSFNPSAAGGTYLVEVAASDDAGNEDGFARAGVLEVLPLR